MNLVQRRNSPPGGRGAWRCFGPTFETRSFSRALSAIHPRLLGYFVLNGRVAYERAVPGGRLSAFFLVNNILDQKYFSQGIIAKNNLTGGGALERFVVPAPGIALYGGLSYRFESF